MQRPPSALERLRQVEAARAAGVAVPAPGEAPAPTGPRSRRGAIFGTLGVIALLGWKMKALLIFALTKAKFLLVALNLGKFLTTASTMLVMIWAYALFYGFPFAAGLVLLILLHELGHGAAAKWVGLPVGAPVFIPFFGAFIALKERPRSTYEDFIIGAGGPVAGSLAAAVCVAVGLSGGEVLGQYWAELLLAVGYVSLLLNLFNLTPVFSLDGARMCAPLTPVYRVIAAAVLIGAVVVAALVSEKLNPMAAIVAGVAAYRAGLVLWQSRRAGPGSRLEQLRELEKARIESPDDAVLPEQRRIAFAVYTGLGAVLIIATHLLLPLLRAPGF